MTDHEIILQIQEWLDGVEWTPDALMDIALLLAQNGYQIRSSKDDTPIVADT